MTALEYFNEVTSGAWETIGADIQYKVKDRVLYIACTNSLLDWKNNFNAKWAKHNRAIVHAGYHKVLSSAPELLALDYDTIVGYSFGGGLATLLHYDLAYLGRTVKTITFGAPRVFVLPFLKGKHFKTLTRFQNIGDIVTKVPFNSMGYFHVGKTVELSGQEDFTELDPVEFIERMTGHATALYRKRLANV